jgi:tripartite-type tricarboxylate transporter receptor subunit TctC
MSLASPAFSQDFPAKPVRLVVAFTPGGGADTTARIVAERLSELWKQQVVVENRPGAGGSIGADAVAKSAPDGYTLMIASNTHVINQVVYPNLTFDIREFTPIAVLTNAPMVIAVNSALIQARGIREFTAMLKGSPGKYSYTACNVASTPHFAMEMYKHALGINAVHVPHKGCGPAVNDTVAGHIGIVATVLPPAAPFIKQGRLRAIALLDAERSPAAPDIPTLRESGIPELRNVSLQSYHGVMAPPGLPAALAQSIERDVLKVAATPEVRKRLEMAGLDMFLLDAPKMQTLFRTDYDNLARIAKEANIRAE